MPELPEVETVKRTLEALVIGKEIERVSVFWPKMVKRPDEVIQFQDALKGQTIHSMGRRGKFIIFYSDDFALVSHLRMEGKYGVFQGRSRLKSILISFSILLTEQNFATRMFVSLERCICFKRERNLIKNH